ncbi:alpha-protein kinase 3 isoform X2 [Pleurodeles waltl]|uniref:alpha-protein kinase 3 isoform X2 n=1 Tax=Pleurodeles waltl TaxID=8319 RepID=UPI0037095D1B
MGTRRALERAPAPGRHQSTNGTEAPAEEEVVGPGVRPDSRNYLLNVRPENRTTFCAIISQLTEETQPSFEATLKSRAVSENCDAKFTCIVSGFPEPELTWYKDDEEMDRYCGLPKYEILRNGKRHTLQLYKCREEDAAIYQASARNSKGIVSCSGVLEVGTMTEYKIHQRWFAKLKRKAEAKMREIEQSRRRDKENVLDKLRALSPERFQRKRRFSAEDSKKSPALVNKEDVIKVHIPDSTTRLKVDVAESGKEQLINGESEFANEILSRQTGEITTNGYVSSENLEEDGKEFLAYVCETVEIITKKPTDKESTAKKKKKEDASAVIPLKQDEKSSVVVTQKIQGPNPAPIRSPFSAAPPKNQADEKMEVEKTSAVQVKSATSSPKFPKITFVRDTKRNKDAEILKKKDPEVCNAPVCSVPSKEEGYFSLRDMYLENTVLPAEEKKTPPIPVRSKAKADYQGLKFPKEKPPETSRQEGPVVTHKHAPGQKEKSTRHEVQAERTTGVKLKQIDGKSLYTDSKSMELKKQSKVSESDPEIQRSPPLQKRPAPGKSGLQSNSALMPSVTHSGESHKLEIIQSDDQLLLKTVAAKQQNVPSSEKDNLKDFPEICKEQLDVETPSEVAAREEALQKYHQLEMEYRALQQAYSVLQQQFEQTLKSSKETEGVNHTSASILRENSISERAVKNEEHAATVLEVINPQFPSSESNLSPTERLESKNPAAELKTNVPPTSEPKPPARKLKGHMSELNVSESAPNSPELELKMTQPMLKGLLLEQTELKAPLRRTKAPVPEAKVLASELKETTTEPSELKTSVVEVKILVPEPSITDISPELKSPLPQLKAPMPRQKDSQSKPELEGHLPQLKVPMPGQKDAESKSKAVASQPRPTAPNLEMPVPTLSKDKLDNVNNDRVVDVPVYMETESPEKENIAHISKVEVSATLNVDYREAEHLLDKSKMPSSDSLGKPKVCIQYSSEGSGHSETKDGVAVMVGGKEVKVLLPPNIDIMGDVADHKTNALRPLLKECIPSQGANSLSETFGFPDEVEMIEDIKDQQANDSVTVFSKSLIEEHQPSTEIDLPTMKKKSLSTSHDSTSLDVVGNVSQIGTGIISECADEETHSKLTGTIFPPSTESQHHDHPIDVSNIEMPVSSSGESVATLICDVKKEMDTKSSSEVASTTERDNAIDLLSGCSLSPEQDLDVEMTLQVSQGEVNEQKRAVMPSTITQASEEDGSKINLLSPDISKTKDLVCTTATMPSIPQGTQEVVLDNFSTNQEKQNSGFVASLKNSLLMLLNITKNETDKNKIDTKDSVKVDKEEKDNSSNTSLFSDLGTGSSSLVANTNVETDKSDTCIQKEESLTSSSTSGIMTPSSDEEMVPNVDVLQQRKFAEVIDKELFPDVEISCIGPGATTTDQMTSQDQFSRNADISAQRQEAGKVTLEAEGTSLLVPSIVVANFPHMECVQTNDMPSDLQLDTNENAKSDDIISMIPAATPHELALGARRKIYVSKSKQLEDADSNNFDSMTGQGSTKRDSPTVSPGLSRRNQTLLQASMASQSPPVERRSPGLARKMTTLEVPKVYAESSEGNSSGGGKLEENNSYADMKDDLGELKRANDPFKAPQVIRKIRAEQFSDSSGNLKLWCQFFNVLSDSKISWFKDEYPVAEASRCAGDEGQVALAIVQASKNDCGVYQCTIQNKYGTDSTDFLLSAEALSGFITREETEVGEEIEMTPMVFAKGLADSGYWGDKFFGRIVAEDVNVGKGYLRKILRVKVIYGLEPIFESGKTCIIKIRNLITFGTKNESTLLENNYDLTIQSCKIQNTTREYCKIFAAEARVVPNFGQILEIIPLNLIYRPANNIPYATIEDDLEGRFEKYCIKDKSGNLHMKNTSEIEKKCCAFQHWVYQWTNGNVLITDLQGVGWKITNVAIATKSKGYQGLKESCCPSSVELFVSLHQCNRYCEMLGLRSLKSIDTLQTPAKPKGSKSPSMGRKAGSTQSSPQIPKKGMPSPQGPRKSAVSPKTARKVTETGELQPSAKQKTVETSKPAKMR